MNWYMLVISILATWRVSHLLQAEDGPFNIIYHLRKKAGAGFFGSLLDCFYCISMWTALIPGLWLGNTWAEKILLWLALSGGACLLEQLSTHNNTSHYSED